MRLPLMMMMLCTASRTQRLLCAHMHTQHVRHVVLYFVCMCLHAQCTRCCTYVHDRVDEMMPLSSRHAERAHSRERRRLCNLFKWFRSRCERCCCADACVCAPVLTGLACACASNAACVYVNRMRHQKLVCTEREAWQFPENGRQPPPTTSSVECSRNRHAYCIHLCTCNCTSSNAHKHTVRKRSCDSNSSINFVFMRAYARRMSACVFRLPEAHTQTQKTNACIVIFALLYKFHRIFVVAVVSLR